MIPTREQQKAQGAKCGCRGTDDMCVCQNVVTGVYDAPTAPGFYWAKWQIADPGTPEAEHQTPSSEWEIVRVLENATDRCDPKHLLVYVWGQTRGQSVPNFVWGPGPLAPPVSA